MYQNLNEIKNYVIGKNVTAIIGKSTPQQSDESVTELFEFLKIKFKYKNFKCLYKR